MRKITAEEDQDVVLTISPTHWEQVPQEIAREIEHYGNSYDKKGNYVITIPLYKWREVLKIMRALEG